MVSLDELDDAWAVFSDIPRGETAHSDTGDGSVIESHTAMRLDGIAPDPSDIYISTKTKISYLSHPVSLSDAFWEIPVIPYHSPVEGVVKKQMKFNSASASELTEIQEKMATLDCVDEHIIQRIVNPEGRIKFRDVRKISIGIAKKDIVSYRRKKRGAFYNCFVMILRVCINNVFKEIHVKVFNTGKLEIPGIQDSATLSRVLQLVIEVLKPLDSTEPDIVCFDEKTETVLINSNFSCGFFIDRDKLYHKLRHDYDIVTSYDPCSYPGIQSTFYHDSSLSVQTGKHPGNGHSMSGITKVSFMVFRTGSVLIVGKSTEEVLEDIYIYLKELLRAEYSEIGCHGQQGDSPGDAKCQRKARRKTMTIGQ